MKLILSAALCFCLQFTFGQKLDIMSLEKILSASLSSADFLLRNSKFAMADKKSGDNYFNYYYTSYEKVDSAQLIRSLTIMDVFDASSTSRFILYRTYTKRDQDELELQLSTAGYLLAKRTATEFTYKKDDRTIINRIVEKDLGSTRKVKVYEFELGR